MLQVIGVLLGFFGIANFLKEWKTSDRKKAVIDSLIDRDSRKERIYPEEYTYAAGLADELGMIHTSMALRKKREQINAVVKQPAPLGAPPVA